MKILLDEDLPHRLRHALVGHDAQTVLYAGWAGIKNGRLLRIAEDAGFDILLTGDQRIPSQQNLAARTIAVIVLSAVNFDIMQPHLKQIHDAIATALPGSLQHVECGRFSRRS